MTAAVQKFLEEVLVHFPRREASETDEMMWVRSMKREMEGFSPAVLAKAAQIIIGTCDRRDFQWLPKQCKAACYEADKLLKAERPRLVGTEPPAPHVATTADRERLAMELILGPMGRQATREGWIHSLYTFARDHMRLPSTDKPCTDKRQMHREHGPCSEVECCKYAARGFDKAFDDCRAADPASLQGKLVKLGLSMAQKRDALAKYVETGVLP